MRARMAFRSVAEHLQAGPPTALVIPYGMAHLAPLGPLSAVRPRPIPLDERPAQAEDEHVAGVERGGLKRHGGDALSIARFVLDTLLAFCSRHGAGRIRIRTTTFLPLRCSSRVSYVSLTTCLNPLATPPARYSIFLNSSRN